MSKAKSPERLSIGERIAYARDKYRLSQAQLGANLGVTRAAISQYEQDKIRPRSKVFDKLAAMFHSDPEWFERGRGKAPDPLDAPVTIYEVNVENLTESVMHLRDLYNGRQWRLPTAMFADTKFAPDHMIAILAPNAVQPIRRGDRVVINTQGLEPADAVFLVIDAAKGPVLRRYEPGCVRVVGQAVAYFHTL